ncbi:unnamed protein product [Discula destructiva]
MPSIWKLLLSRRSIDGVQWDELRLGSSALEASQDTPPSPAPEIQQDDLDSSRALLPLVERVITLTHAILEPSPLTSVPTTSEAELTSSTTPPSLLPSTTTRRSTTTSTPQSRPTIQPSASSSSVPVQSPSSSAVTSAPQSTLPQSTLPQPITSSLATSAPPILVPVPTASLSPIVPEPATPNAATDGVPSQDAAPPPVAAVATSGMDAGSIVGFVMLALVGLAALIGLFAFLKKRTTKKRTVYVEPRGGSIIVNKSLSFFNHTNDDSDDESMIMARAHPEIADKLSAIAYRVANGGHNPPLPSKSSNNPPAPMTRDPVARTFPGIAAQLDAIATRAEKGDVPLMLSAVTYQPPSVKEESGEPQESSRHNHQRIQVLPPPPPHVEATQTRYLVPREDRSEWVTVSPGIGPSAPGRAAPLNFYTARESRYYQMDSPVKAPAVRKDW